MFRIYDAGVCHIIRRLEAILASVMTIEKHKKLSREEMENLIIDATELPLEPPKRPQKPYYSGKKSAILLRQKSASQKRGASFMCLKRLPKEKGYQGIADMHQNADFLINQEITQRCLGFGALSSTFLATSKRLKLCLMATATKLNVTP
jgi:hypothetical protein